ncbi:TetR/AcrR family transcriptional regulator [Nocardia vulneris]|uniref:TetR family transcriptional regulator n=1 Tax=Nocardia vulneris TaxID=1141657 RepID=A0ABR4Z7Q5_9NOCA|nr:TetR/AcrR family transcriptional regulator [Nocardia vulneris]KIA61314.1 TetR family transcriptional regulator [Nocardia vulneris]
MPKQVDHDERRALIARALWRVVDERGVFRLSMREVAQAAGMSLGQLQHYFASREAMLSFAVDFAGEQTGLRVQQALGTDPHPRAALRVLLTELLPLRPEARATSRLHAAYVLVALHDPAVHDRAREGLLRGRDLVEQLVRRAITDGEIADERDPVLETDRLLALTGFTSLLELGVVTPEQVFAAIDQHLQELFAER